MKFRYTIRVVRRSFPLHIIALESLKIFTQISIKVFRVQSRVSFVKGRGKYGGAQLFLLQTNVYRSFLLHTIAFESLHSNKAPMLLVFAWVSFPIVLVSSIAWFCKIELCVVVLHSSSCNSPTNLHYGVLQDQSWVFGSQRKNRAHSSFC